MATMTEQAEMVRLDAAQAAVKAEFARLGRERCAELCKHLGPSPRVAMGQRTAAIEWLDRALSILRAA